MGRRRGRPENSKIIPVILDADHLALLGRVRYELGDRGNPCSVADAVRGALRFFADYIQAEKERALGDKKTA